MMFVTNQDKTFAIPKERIAEITRNGTEVFAFIRTVELPSYVVKFPLGKYETEKDAKEAIAKYADFVF